MSIRISGLCKAISAVAAACLLSVWCFSGDARVLADAGIIKVEAESGLVSNGKASIGVNPNGTSSGQYVENIDNVGEGIEVKAAVPEAGKYDLTVYYMTGAPGSCHEVFVNGVSAGKVTYTENTGWCGGTNVNFKPAVLADVELTAGENTVKIVKSGADDGYAQIDYITLSKPGSAPPESQAAKIEAESGTLEGSKANVQNYAKASGGSVVAQIDDIGGGLTLTAKADKAGTYDLVVYYMNGMGSPQTHGVRVNGTDVGKVTYATNTGWADSAAAAASAAVRIMLQAGDNTLFLGRLEDSDGYAQLDYITLTRTGDLPVPAADRIELETGTVAGGAQALANDAASGKAYVRGMDAVGAYVEVKTTVDKAGVYDLTVYYMTEIADYNPSPCHEVLINGVSAGQVRYTENTGWAVPNTSGIPAANPKPAVLSVQLKAGENIIRIAKTADSDGFAELDYITLTRTGDLPSALSNRIEAESGEPLGGAVTREGAQASGGRFLAGVDAVGAGARYYVTADKAGNYELAIGYITTMQPARHAVFVNGISFGYASYTESTGGWGDTAGFTGAKTALVVVTLDKGLNTLEIRRSGDADSFAELDYIDWGPTDKEASSPADKTVLPVPAEIGVDTVRIEAEEAQLLGAAAKSSLDGASKDAYVGGLSVGGAGVEFVLDAATAGDYELTIGYNAGSAAKQELFLNGVTAGTVRYPQSGGWSIVTRKVSLVEGVNRVKLVRFGDGAADLDYIELTGTSGPQASAPPVKGERVELTQDMLLGGAYLIQDAQATGGSYAGGIDAVGDGVAFTQHVDKAGAYTLTVGYFCAQPTAYLSLEVNGEPAGTLAFDQNTAIGMTFPDQTYAQGLLKVEVPLKAGGNIIRLLKANADSGFVDLDFADVLLADSGELTQSSTSVTESTGSAAQGTQSAASNSAAPSEGTEDTASEPTFSMQGTGAGEASSPVPGTQDAGADGKADNAETGMAHCLGTAAAAALASGLLLWLLRRRKKIGNSR